MAVDIRLAKARVVQEASVFGDQQSLCIPGDEIKTETGFMRGHGTNVEETDDGKAENRKLLSTVAGVIEKVNKLICVQPLKTRYNGEVGDVVVGRIIGVGPKRWKVDTKSKLDSLLMLSAVNLPGGELRRRSEEDERMMREYLAEGDLISAEVQSVYHDGMLSLHTRSLKYGKLAQGVLLSVSPSLIKRRKSHFHSLPCGASVILGNNGYIWISPTLGHDIDNAGGYIQNKDPVPRADREVIARLRNCILALAEHRAMLYDTNILYAYEVSATYTVRDILKPEVMREVAELAQQRIEQES